MEEKKKSEPATINDECLYPRVQAAKRATELASAYTEFVRLKENEPLSPQYQGALTVRSTMS